MKKIFTIFMAMVVAVGCSRFSEVDTKPIIIDSGNHIRVPFSATAGLGDGEVTKAIIENNMPKWEQGDSIQLAYTKTDGNLGVVSLVVSEITNNGAKATLEGELIDPADQTKFYAVYGGTLTIENNQPKAEFEYYDIEDYEEIILNPFHDIRNDFYDRYDTSHGVVPPFEWFQDPAAMITLAELGRHDIFHQRLRMYSETEIESLDQKHVLGFTYACAYFHIYGDKVVLQADADHGSTLEIAPFIDGHINSLDPDSPIKFATKSSYDFGSGRLVNTDFTAYQESIMIYWFPALQLQDLYIACSPIYLQNGYVIGMTQATEYIDQDKHNALVSAFGLETGKSIEAGHIYNYDSSAHEYQDMTINNTTADVEYDSSLKRYLNGDIEGANNFDHTFYIGHVKAHNTTKIAKVFRKRLRIGSHLQDVDHEDNHDYMATNVTENSTEFDVNDHISYFAQRDSQNNLVTPYYSSFSFAFERYSDLIDGTHNGNNNNNSRIIANEFCYSILPLKLDSFDGSINYFKGVNPTYENNKLLLNQSKYRSSGYDYHCSPVIDLYTTHAPLALTNLKMHIKADVEVVWNGAAGNNIVVKVFEGNLSNYYEDYVIYNNTFTLNPTGTTTIEFDLTTQIGGTHSSQEYDDLTNSYITVERPNSDSNIYFQMEPTANGATDTANKVLLHNLYITYAE